MKVHVIMRLTKLTHSPITHPNPLPSNTPTIVYNPLYQAVLGTAMKVHVIMRLTKLKLRQDTADALGRDLNLSFKPAHMSGTVNTPCHTPTNT